MRNGCRNVRLISGTLCVTLPGPDRDRQAVQINCYRGKENGE